MKTRYLLLFFLTLTLSCKEKSPPVTPVAVDLVKEFLASVTTRVGAIDSLSLFNQYLKSAKLAEENATNGITIFAPVNAAIAAATRNNLLPDSSSVEDYIIKGIVKPEDLKDGQKLNSISGKVVTISVENSMIYANKILIFPGTPIVNDPKIVVYTTHSLYASKYVDPYANEYFFEYYINGTYITWKNRFVDSWPLSARQNYQPAKSGNCGPSDNFLFTEINFSNPNAEIPIMATLRIRTRGYDRIPELGSYYLANSTSDQDRTCNFTVLNRPLKTAFTCDGENSYVRINITEVKILSGAGKQRRGYYKGTFSAILYSGNPDVFSVPPTPGTRVPFASGSFMLPIGGYDDGGGSHVESVELKGEGDPQVFSKKTLLLTSDIWFIYSEASHEGTELWSQFLEPCETDDYVRYMTNGTATVSSGATSCKTACDACYGNTHWIFTDNETKIQIAAAPVTPGGGSVDIIELTETTLITRSTITDDEGTTYFTHTYKHKR